MAIISNLLRLIAKPIFLKLGKGLKSSKTQYCLGDELDIRLDESIIGKDNVIAKPPTRINSFSRWVDGDAKQITDGKTVQDDNGNTDTTVSQPGKDLIFTLENNADVANSNTRVRLRTGGENSGDPYINYAIAGQTNWSIGINNRDRDAFVISQAPNLDSREFFRINTAGNVTFPNQYTAYATLTENTGGITNNTEYYLGQGTPLTVVINQGGYFFAGAGNVNNPAKYTVFEKCTLLVYISGFVTTDLNEQTEVIARIRVSGSITRSTSFLVTRPGSVTKGSAFMQNGVLGLPGDIINFTFFARSGNSNQKWRIIKELGDTYTTFIGIRCLG